MSESVSVVIPVYNRAATLARAIDSVLAQTHPVEEIWIVDDGSRDDSPAVAQRYAARHESVRFLRQHHAGAASARNLGMSQANSTWIAFLDSDDRWHPEKNARCMQMINSCPECDFLHTSYFVERNGNLQPRLNNVREIREDRKRMLSIFGVKTSTVCFRHSLLDGTGFFREDLHTCEDYELFWRLIAVSRRIAYLTDNLVTVVESANSLTAVTDPLDRRKDDALAISSALTWIRTRSDDPELVSGMRSHQYWAFVELMRVGLKTASLPAVAQSFGFAARHLGLSRGSRAAMSALASLHRDTRENRRPG
ncbi:MAG: glycosyltransferase family 2 protein [Burkholderiaceae bacterium]|nr:glycosyltransferase family 2 protein [Burkholderiaceae bacterium]